MIRRDFISCLVLLGACAFSGDPSWPGAGLDLCLGSVYADTGTELTSVYGDK